MNPGKTVRIFPAAEVEAHSASIMKSKVDK